MTTARDSIPKFLRRLSVQELLICSRGVVDELRDRGVVRSANAPTGDYAEWLVHQTRGGTLAGQSQKSYDIVTPDDVRLQVKARVVTSMKRKSDRQLSTIRTWDFDLLVVLLFNQPEFAIERAAAVPSTVAQDAAYWSKHTNGHIVYATDELLANGEDWTTELRATQEGLR